MTLMTLINTGTYMVEGRQTDLTTAVKTLSKTSVRTT